MKHFLIILILIIFLFPSISQAKDISLLNTLVVEGGKGICNGHYACYFSDFNLIIFDSLLTRLPTKMSNYVILHEIGHHITWNSTDTEKQSEIKADEFAKSILGYSL